ncbi:hypothetical protein MNBD_NITROSPIRAE01-2275 [hydrothermal vent metagenome]|uniref:Uncharacterized protein n=1 Tax=hydrothermal vent metagenome TaxID=652676 RepID=A0A3B1CLU0_9ZZZZ
MNKFFLLWGFLFLVFFVVTPEVMAKVEAVVGIPIIQTRSSIEISHNVTLDNNEKMLNQLVIIKDEGKYYWETRDRKELLLHKTKHFDLFIDPSSGGYIKIIQQADGRYVYMEHTSNKNLKVFTYWGIATTYNP